MTMTLAALEVLLNDAVTRDRTTARRKTLLDILTRERFLTRSQLMMRVETVIGNSCFGASAWEDTFYRDMQVVKRALLAGGYHLAYRRSIRRRGYYLRDQPAIGEELSAALDGSIAEVDPAQIAILRRLSFRQRFQQGCSITNLAHRVVAYRVYQRNPKQTLAEAKRMAICRDRNP
jgi:hypothetical protein